MSKYQVQTDHGTFEVEVADATPPTGVAPSPQIGTPKAGQPPDIHMQGTPEYERTQAIPKDAEVLGGPVIPQGAFLPNVLAYGADALGHLAGLPDWASATAGAVTGLAGGGLMSKGLPQFMQEGIPGVVGKPISSILKLGGSEMEAAAQRSAAAKNAIEAWKHGGGQPNPPFQPSAGSTPGFVPPVPSSETIGVPSNLPSGRVPGPAPLPEPLPPRPDPAWSNIQINPRTSMPGINANGLPLTLPSGRTVGPAPSINPTPQNVRLTPEWQGISTTSSGGNIPDLPSIPSNLPSGRSVGPSPTVPPVLPTRAAPAWQDIQLNPRPSMTDVDPIRGPLPSGRDPNSIFRSGSIQPVEGGPVPIQPLPPIDKFEMNRMIHARAQEIDLPGSPAGKNAHPQLSLAAQSNYGAKSFADLTVDQMRKIYDYLSTQKRLPINGELKLK